MAKCRRELRQERMRILPSEASAKGVPCVCGMSFMTWVEFPERADETHTRSLNRPLNSGRDEPSEASGRGYEKYEMSQWTLEHNAFVLGERTDAMALPVEVKLPDGSRLNAVIPALEFRGVMVSIGLSSPRSPW